MPYLKLWKKLFYDFPPHLLLSYILLLDIILSPQHTLILVDFNGQYSFTFTYVFTLSEVADDYLNFFTSIWNNFPFFSLFCQWTLSNFVYLRMIYFSKYRILVWHFKHVNPLTYVFVSIHWDFFFLKTMCSFCFPGCS